MQPLVRFALYAFIITFCTVTLFVTRSLLEPLAIAGILAMLFIPVSSFLERKGFHRIVASIVCVLSFVLIVGAVIAAFYSQLYSIGGNIINIKENISQSAGKLQHFLQDNLSIPISRQNNILNRQQSAASDGMGKMMTYIAGSFLSLVIGITLTLVYMVILLNYRTHLKTFILKIVPPDEKQKAQKIIIQSAKVVQRYFTGLAVIIVCLWLMYGIGFSIVGLKGALFFAILCGTFEIIPFVGNITGCSVAALMAFSQGGGFEMVAGIIATYLIIQSIQFYIIAPLVFGEEININPLFIIFILLAGELIWGVPGMVIAIPVLGIAKTIFENVERLKPYGYLIGKENGKRHNSFILKIKGLFKGKH